MNQNKFPMANLYLSVITHHIINSMKNLLLSETWTNYWIFFINVNSHCKVIVCYVDGWSAYKPW